MNNILEVEFKGGRTEACLNPMEFPFEVGDYVLVEVDKGENLGRIAHLDLKSKIKNPEEIQFRVLRKALAKDLQTFKEICCREHESMKICKRKVIEHGLPMKLVDVEYQFDLRKLTFYFTAEGRVDFRELVKDLAAHFKVRIELRQIGVRDETKRLGGLGICGLQLCCTTFLDHFCPITTQMAKLQNLSLNPQKLSGTCGRLKCCLKYEVDSYQQELQHYPTRESIYLTPRGEAVIEKIDIFTGLIYMKFLSGEWERYNLAELSQMTCLKEAEPVPLEDFNSRHHENGDSENGNSHHYKNWNYGIPPKKDSSTASNEMDNQDNNLTNTEGNVTL